MKLVDAIAFLKSTNRTLATQQDLSPNNPNVNTCLTRLVKVLREWQRDGFGYDLPDHPELAAIARDLPGLCADAEYEMEKWWCRKILASGCPGAQALAAFWYIDDYKALCQTELKLLGEESVGRFAFLGSGALPLTAILLAQSCPSACIKCVDRDQESCDLAEKLFTLFGLADRVTMNAMDAEDYRPDAEETVVCASLLRAPHIFDRLRDQNVRRLIVRDAEGPYRFLYRPAELPRHGYAELAKSVLCTEHVNTSRYFELI
jgi:hypothetical protein